MSRTKQCARKNRHHGETSKSGKNIKNGHNGQASLPKPGQECTAGAPKREVMTAACPQGVSKRNWRYWTKWAFVKAFEEESNDVWRNWVIDEMPPRVARDILQHSDKSMQVMAMATYAALHWNHGFMRTCSCHGCQAYQTRLMGHADKADKTEKTDEERVRHLCEACVMPGV